MTSIMSKEAAEAPVRVKEQLTQNQAACERLGHQIRLFEPAFVLMVGRGSSDHAGVFAKYLIEVETGVPVTASAPSVASIYGQNLKLDKALVLVISQSGRSPDILAQAKSAKASGALVVALVNDESSPLAEMVDHVLPLNAGEEKAVAATKSYLCTLSALLQMVAYWKQDKSLIESLDHLPEGLQKAVDAPAQLDRVFIKPLAHCVVLGRSFGYAIARELALKLKEVVAVHAEAFSSAEFLHGPVTLVQKQLAVVDIEVTDESVEAHREQIKEIKHRGAKLCHLSNPAPDLHPRLAPLAIMQRFYLDIENVAQQMGLDPDNPEGLKKVTQTL
ncbi:Glutamine--fructose-6-phosphate transaminase (isomerizing) [Saliniradius amylolyticus]|uniref:Glutamine--fructose-6-phosphate transaminase (Isomerizing) n=1 Tax=Saliniradius amylolyticus TaxID=2183582 RepID=A0A2S2E2V1_9ALTE|nr:SIS domain-containing protein [Saliniradius amylolyticus]AWL11975.1 Glutamine--fructose-6-phosphate transaminase (isomerizing) [Saliniradius amylolyticus]